MSEAKTLLEIDQLRIRFGSDDNSFEAVKALTFQIQKGKCMGLVGESGSGKSVSSLSLMGLLGANAQVDAINMKMELNGDLVSLDQLQSDQWTKVRGRHIAMVFQEPMTSLNPVMTCGKQIVEALVHHFKMEAAIAKEKTLKLFEEVQLPDPERAFNSYPHELSGGQRQRIVIAMALSCDPDLLIADEPTTALDVTVQHSILKLLKELMESRNMGMIFISHDLAVVANIANEVAVLFRGELLEKGPVEQVIHHPKHPYTKGLLECRPKMGEKRNRLPTVDDFMKEEDHQKILQSEYYRQLSATEIQLRKEHLMQQETLLNVEDLSVHFEKGQSVVKAVDGVSFSVATGEVLGLVGESGCGKSTLSRAILGLSPLQSGQVSYQDQILRAVGKDVDQKWRKKIQLIFQDPMSSLNPGMTVGQIITEPMKVHGIHSTKEARREKAQELLMKVGLSAEDLVKYPHEFSGGQRQRIVIARALAVEPEFIICDESVAALDVSVQAQVLNLLADLKEEFGLTYIFITHDFAVVNQISDRIMVMNKGKIEELNWTNELVSQPKSEYTKKLIHSIPRIQ